MRPSFTSLGFAWLFAAATMAPSVRAGFDWGDGCGGGSGEFTQNLPTAGETASIGEIAVGKWNLLIKLESTKDVDVQLFDKNDETCSGGEKAIIAYSEKKGCGKGTLGNNDGTKESTVYKGMHISYSGYYGVDGKVGFEYIRLEGEVKTPLIMKAFAFEAGDAKVTYEWGYTRTPQCLGILPNTGTMQASVVKGDSVAIGEIPVGKKDLKITLTAEADVDVTLYDKGTDSLAVCTDTGKPIIQYSEDTDQCKKGPLGNNDGTEESVVYNAITYSYSGYDGVEGKKGSEWVKLTGVSNTPLMMSAYGYASGDFTVDYEYYENVPDGEVPTAPSVHWLATKNNKLAGTDIFTGVPADYNIVRRGKSFEFLIFGGAGNTLSKDNVNIAITGVVATSTFSGDPRITTNDLEARKTSEFKRSITTTQEAYPADAYTVEFENESENRFLVKVSFTSSAPVGEFKITAKVNIGEGRTAKTAEAHQNFIVLFDPYNSDDVVYTTKANRAEYIENTKGLVWQGLSDNNNGFAWDFNQWDFANLQIAYDRLIRMPVADRGDPVLVSRHISYSVGEDICYGKWGEGSYTTGKPYGGYTCSSSKKCTTPDDWRDSTSLFKTHRDIGMKVQYCQCFVYAAITTSIGRSLGIPTRPVTTFQSAHDTDKNRAIEKFYTIDPTNGEFVPQDNAPTSDSVWSFHVWNEMYFDRPEFDYAACNAMGQRKGCADGWQAVDATPQETSKGGSGLDPNTAYYQMGPASIKLLLKNKDPVCPYNSDTKYGCFDNEFVLSEVNSNVHMWIKTDDATKEYSPGLGYELYGNVGYMSDAWGDKYNTIGLQISTKKKGGISAECLKEDETKDCSKELDDVTKYYKKKEDSGPDLPTLPANRLKSDVPEGTEDYYKPDLGASGHRRLLRQGERRTGTGAVSKVTMKPIGTAPAAGNVPVVNEHGHLFSSVYVEAPFENGHDSSTYTVKCGFVVNTTDYSAQHSAQVFKSHSEVSLAPGETKSCKFEVHRDSWWEKAETAMDKYHAGRETTEMSTNEKAFALKMEVTGYVVETKEPLGVIEKLKTLCTPSGATSTRSGGMNCEGHRGRVEVTSELMDHITTCEQAKRDTATTTDDLSLSSNNGKCNPENNNAEKCWDGGDCCKSTCLFRWGNMFGLDGKLDDWECDELTDDQCLDTTVQSYPTSYDFTTSEQLLGEPTSFSGLGAEDFGESICSLVVEYFDDLLVNDASTGQCRALGEDSDECAAELKTVLCDDTNFPTGLADCESALIESTFLTKDNKPRCPTVAAADLKTQSGCTCQDTWSYTWEETDYEYTNGYCGNPDSDQNGNWCIVVDGSCSTTATNGDVGRAVADDGTSGFYWDYCISDQPRGPATWTDSEVLKLFPEANNLAPASTGATEMLILETPEVNPNTCSETQYLNENTGVCVNMCSDDEAMVGGVCKTVCDSRRRLDITDPCIALADGEGDCESPVIPTPSPIAPVSPTPVIPTPSPIAPVSPTPVIPTPSPIAPVSPTPVIPTPSPIAPVSPTPVSPTPVVAESVEVDGSLSFSGFQAESFPTEGTPEYEGFKGDVKKGIATSLGVDADKVTILAMTLGGRRVRGRSLTETTLKVVFKVEVPKRSSGDEATKVSDDLKSVDVVANVKAASSDNDDTIWSGVDVNDASVTTHKPSEENEEEEEEEEEEEDDGKRDDSWLLPSHQSFLVYLGAGAGAISFLALIGSFVCRSGQGGEERRRLTGGIPNSAL